MLGTTPEYHILCHSLATAKLSIRDLPDTNIRDELDEMRLKSFIFLCHAAVEEYFENVTKGALIRSKVTLFDSRRIPKILMSAVSHYQLKLKGNWPAISSESDEINALGGMLELAIREHTQTVYENHGIKTKDQDNLCLPLGIRVHDFDHILSQNLNSFGEGRGKIAHGFRIKQLIPKVGCVQSVATLSALLLPFDQEIDRVIGEVW